jgi:hypothetical protein
MTHNSRHATAPSHSDQSPHHSLLLLLLPLLLPPLPLLLLLLLPSCRYSMPLVEKRQLNHDTFFLRFALPSPQHRYCFVYLWCKNDNDKIKW